MIIDCHGHYTTAPAQQQHFRKAQLSRLADVTLPEPTLAPISDDQIRESIEQNQLRIMRERGLDFVVFSPRAAGMEHHVSDLPTAKAWARVCNDLIARVVGLYPKHFGGVCQLPQVPNGPIDDLVHELRRCVDELGFVGCNLNPDPSGGYWTAPPMTDPYWYPLYEAMCELQVPAMIHVSSSCNPAVHDLGAHYLNADTTVFMQLVQGDLFGRFPDLKLIIPHGGGAVPYHWGRYCGLVERLGRPPLAQHVMKNVFFDTAVYHQAGMALLSSVIGAQNLIFASEMLGAVRGINPEIASSWDDTKRYIDRLDLSAQERALIFDRNAGVVFPRLAAHLRNAGRATVSHSSAI